MLGGESEDQGVWVEEASETFVVDYTKIQNIITLINEQKFQKDQRNEVGQLWEILG